LNDQLVYITNIINLLQQQNECLSHVEENQDKIPIAFTTQIEVAQLN